MTIHDINEGKFACVQYWIVARKIVCYFYKSANAQVMKLSF